MKLDDWGQRWSDGQIGFHQDKVTGSLELYSDQVLGSSPGRVLVPLCGKTLDMVFLAQRADAVVGVEYVEQAIQEFFDEQDLDASVEPGPPRVYRAERYVLFASDIFLVTAEHTGHIDGVFDRASLVALEAPVRRRYADHLATILQPGAKVLLVTFAYDQAQMPGPPFAVSDDEVGELFGQRFDIEHLRTRDVLDDRFRERGLTVMTESTFAMTRR